MGQLNATALPEDTIPVASDYIYGMRRGGDAAFPAFSTVPVEWTIGPAAGITAGSGTVCRTWRQRLGQVIYSGILVDLDGLTISGTAGDIIGVDGSSSPAYLGRVTTDDHGLIAGLRMTCLETPAGGDTDIDLYSATEATGVENGAISGLTGTQILNAGASSVGSVDYAATVAADQYLYLVGQTGGDAEYTAGRLLIEMWGVDQ
jgi:hypothetical protein